MFVKGNPGGPGRPKGSKDKDRQNYLDLQLWARMVHEGSLKVTPKEKIEVGFRALSLLLPKIATLPISPGDSVANAMQAMEMVKLLEVPENGTEAPSLNTNGINANGQ